MQEGQTRGANAERLDLRGSERFTVDGISISPCAPRLCLAPISQAPAAYGLRIVEFRGAPLALVPPSMEPGQPWPNMPSNARRAGVPLSGEPMAERGGAAEGWPACSSRSPAQQPKICCTPVHLPPVNRGGSAVRTGASRHRHHLEPRRLRPYLLPGLVPDSCPESRREPLATSRDVARLDCDGRRIACVERPHRSVQSRATACPTVRNRGICRPPDRAWRNAWPPFARLASMTNGPQPLRRSERSRRSSPRPRCVSMSCWRSTFVEGVWGGGEALHPPTTAEPPPPVRSSQPAPPFS